MRRDYLTTPKLGWVSYLVGYQGGYTLAKKLIILRNWMIIYVIKCSNNNYLAASVVAVIPACGSGYRAGYLEGFSTALAAAIPVVQLPPLCRARQLWLGSDSPPRRLRPAA